MAAGGAKVLRQSVVALVIASAIAAVGAGCGADTLSPEAALADAATKTSDAGSSRVSFTGTFTFADSDGGPIPFTGSGVFSYDDLTGRFTYDFSGYAESLGLPGGDEWVSDVVMLDDRFFIRFPFLTDDLPEAKPWIEAEIHTESGLSASQLASIGGANDPAQILRFLRGASGEVEEVGSEQVRGVMTRHFRATVEFARVIEQAPEEAQASLREQLDRRVEAGFGDTIDMEVWIDEDGLARRIRQRDPEADITMDLFDFGVDVDVEPPPSDQVMTEQEYDRLIGESE
jgi:hypothetical protein